MIEENILKTIKQLEIENEDELAQFAFTRTIGLIEDNQDQLQREDLIAFAEAEA